MGGDTPAEVLELLDWKRRIFRLYEEVRSSNDPARAWKQWRATRDHLFASHPQSPIAPEARSGFRGLLFYDYRPEARVFGEVRAVEPQKLSIATSGTGPFELTRFATVVFELDGTALSLDAYWLEGYSGGLFLPFADQTSGATTYGGGRYLLDTVKGADLGTSEGRLVLDFNFAYNPSCCYDPRWVCPLTPPANRLAVAIEAGEATSRL